jgi:hypothetical protein
MTTSSAKPAQKGVANYDEQIVHRLTGLMAPAGTDDSPDGDDDLLRGKGQNLYRNRTG